MRRKFEALLIGHGSLHLLFIFLFFCRYLLLIFFRIPTARDLLLAPAHVLFSEGLVDKISFFL